MNGRPYRIPPSNALIAFESAARHANFTLAARELRTPQAAVSRHIARLETWLSARLFERSRAGATLTDAGERFRDGVAAGLAAIHRGAAEAAELSQSEQVVIACSHETSHLFIMPRYDALQRVLGENVRIGFDAGVGIMPPADALKVARAKELDLVEISATASPPVCRIMNYGKYLYQLKKKAHEAKKHQKMIHVKEIKFRPKTDNHDYEFKKKNILRFLEDGDKVKASVNFRGREMAHKSIGRQLILRLIEDVGEQGSVEGNPKMEGNHMFVIFAGKK